MTLLSVDFRQNYCPLRRINIWLLMSAYSPIVSRSGSQAATPLNNRPVYTSRIRESDPPLKLGKLAYYRCTNPASLEALFYTASGALSIVMDNFWTRFGQFLCFFRSLTQKSPPLLRHQHKLFHFHHRLLFRRMNISIHSKRYVAMSQLSTPHFYHCRFFLLSHYPEIF